MFACGVSSQSEVRIAYAIGFTCSEVARATPNIKYLCACFRQHWQQVLARCRMHVWSRYSCCMTNRLGSICIRVLWCIELPVCLQHGFLDPLVLDNTALNQIGDELSV